MQTDDDVDGLFAAASSGSEREDGAPGELGTGIVRGKLHMPTNCRRWIIRVDTLFETWPPLFET